MARSAPMESAVRRVSCDLLLPIETATTSPASPRSLMRTASSTAISSNGFIDIFTLARSTPLPSDLTRTLTLESMTRFTGTSIFMRLSFPAFTTGPLDPVHLATARWRRPYCRPWLKSMVSRHFEWVLGAAPGLVEQDYTAPPHKQDQHCPGRQPANVSPPGDVLLALDQQVDELGGDPDAKRPGRGALDGNPPQRQDPHLHLRMQDERGGDHPGHRA